MCKDLGSIARSPADCSREAMGPGPVEARSVYRGMLRWCGCVQQVTDGWTCEPEGRGSKAHALPQLPSLECRVVGIAGVSSGGETKTEAAGQLDVKCGAAYLGGRWKYRSSR